MNVFTSSDNFQHFMYFVVIMYKDKDEIGVNYSLLTLK